MTNRDWQSVRRQFSYLQRGKDFSLLALGAHPDSLVHEIRRHGEHLEASPHTYESATHRLEFPRFMKAMTEYFGVEGGLATMTYNTTMALAQVYGGLRIETGQEVLTSANEHYCTIESLRLRQRRDGAAFRRIPLYRDSATATADEIVTNVVEALTHSTRAVALTWVASCDGVKLPIRRIADEVRFENARRSPREAQALLVVDGVHGFGVETDTLDELGCDLFVAGCHKWVFGPRGTAIMAGTRAAWPEIVPIVPSGAGPTMGPAFAHYPAGVQPFEHSWTISRALEFLLSIGKPAIRERVHTLASRLKAGLSALGHVDVRTPLSPELSSGIVCVDVHDRRTGAMLPPVDVLERLAKDGITATESSWDMSAGRSHVRFGVTMLNDEDEVDAIVHALTSI